MKLLNKSEALLVMLAADEQVKNTPTYRMGQAIYNLICGELFSHEEIIAVEDHYKWYNSTDAVWCTEYFIEHFVEGGVLL